MDDCKCVRFCDLFLFKWIFFWFKIIVVGVEKPKVFLFMLLTMEWSCNEFVDGWCEL